MRYPFFLAMMAFAALTGPAYAQQVEVNPANQDPFKLQIERQERERRENEAAYNVQMKRLKAQGATQTNSDPWKTVRPADKR